MMGDASLARKYAPSLKPKTNGLPWRAAIMTSGSSLQRATIPKVPITSCKAALTACSKDNLSLR